MARRKVTEAQTSIPGTEPVADKARRVPSVGQVVARVIDMERENAIAADRVAQIARMRYLDRARARREALLAKLHPDARDLAERMLEPALAAMRAKPAAAAVVEPVDEPVDDAESGA